MKAQPSDRWQKSLIIPRLGSALVVCLTLMHTHPLTPMRLEPAQKMALVRVCIVIWPLVLLPWLAGLPRRWQLPCLWLGVLALYVLQGQPPLFGIRHQMSALEVALLLRVLGSIALGVLLLVGLSSLGNKRAAHLLLGGAPVVGYGLLLVAI